MSKLFLNKKTNFSNLLIGITVFLFPLIVNANESVSLRNQFPGRRVGGGTRGECSARYIAHLVDFNSFYAPGKTRLIALIQGPSNNPRPIKTKFGTYIPNKEVEYSYEMTLSNPRASLFLLKAPKIKNPIAWSSSFDCDDDNNNDIGLLDFIEETSPPALSLIVNNISKEDINLQRKVLELSNSCGEEINTLDVFNTFKLGDNMNGKNWPNSLEVICYFNQ